MKNPIPRTSLFTTPDSIEQLQHMAESMSNSSEAWRMMVFTMNYCHQLVEEMLNPAVIDVTDAEIARHIKQMCIEMDIKKAREHLEQIEQLMRS
jgi:uncharacterized protein YwlG (UPF0340 family)